MIVRFWPPASLGGRSIYQRRFLSLAQAGKFSLFKVESIALSVGDTVRITKNFRGSATGFRNNELHTVTAVEAGKITLDSSELPNRGALHLDQGIVVTSHASQGKTVAQVIVSIPIQSFSQGKRGAILRVDEPGAESDAPIYRFKGRAAGGGDPQERQDFAVGIDCGRQCRSHAKRADYKAGRREHRRQESTLIQRQRDTKKTAVYEIPDPER
jgi:hypothetical protein